MKQCEICRESSAKYTCPTCRLKYCSVACYKNHKESPSCKAVKQEAKSVEPDVDLEENRVIPMEDDDRLEKTSLDCLKDSEELQHVLLNPYLREIIRNLDCAPDKEERMTKLMQEPLFTEFADVCLKTVSADEPN